MVKRSLREEPLIIHFMEEVFRLKLLSRNEVTEFGN
jgi:hypothetical protein